MDSVTNTERHRTSNFCITSANTRPVRFRTLHFLTIDKCISKSFFQLTTMSESEEEKKNWINLKMNLFVRLWSTWCHCARWGWCRWQNGEYHTRNITYYPKEFWSGKQAWICCIPYRNDLQKHRPLGFFGTVTMKCFSSHSLKSKVNQQLVCYIQKMINYRVWDQRGGVISWSNYAFSDLSNIHPCAN